MQDKIYVAQTIKVLDLLNLKNWDQCTSSYIKSPLSIQEPVSINSNNLNGTQIEIFLIQSAITNFIFPWPNEAQTSSTIYSCYTKTGVKHYLNCLSIKKSFAYKPKLLNSIKIWNSSMHSI